MNSAKGDAWLRVLGVVKYDNISFGILQEYDGEGFLSLGLSWFCGFRVAI